MNMPRTTFETAVSGFTLCEPFPIDYKVNTNAMDIIYHRDPDVQMVLER